ncbi:jg13209 [Pararge aegeria aegeria]|uniref:Jg13209 protein n=1 Tax=Pararge aegeria aegeria TaxID=348720 RepID=A0A8S4RD71_9NEOP|nr:jg13209 [Pararge aegeria aegeria]
MNKHFMERLVVQGKVEGKRSKAHETKRLRLKVKEMLSSTADIKFFRIITRNKHSMERLVVRRKVEGKPSRGRSPTRWTDIIKAATQTSIVQCSRNAEDRNKWRRIAGAAVAIENVPRPLCQE